jgi:DNA-binding NtrC family response regulator
MTTILIVDDEPAVRFALEEALSTAGHLVIACASAAEARTRAGEADVAITDLVMPDGDGLTLLAELRRDEPDLPVVLLTARGSERVAAAAIKAGAWDYLPKPFAVEELRAVVGRAAEARRLRRVARDAELARSLGTELVGDAPAWRRVVDQARRIARRDVAVLVRGETGTGKELMARAIHEASGRPGEFVAINCGAMPRGLIESELFGHRRGAFSGAGEDRDGLFRRAHQGTLFLDEIAELPPESQVALLRVLQEGEVRPVGASEVVQVDVRVVAASHQDLTRRIADGRFRQDLYGRIAGFQITMPALRDRREDLGTLIATILPRICERPDRFTLHREAACALLRYDWPQNIRELEQALAAAVALCEDGKLRLAHLPEAIASYRPSSNVALSTDDAELRARLVALLEAESGNVAAVARAMGRAPIQIRRWCRRLQIDLAKFRH